MAARSLPDSLPSDVVVFLEEEYFDGADLPIVANFFEAAKALINLPSFQVMKEANQTEQHCVRCHASFTKDSNGPSECTIPHVFDTEPEFTGEVAYDKVYSYKSTCCGPSVEVEEEGYGNSTFRNLDRLGYCFEGYHTMDADEVEDEDEYNDVNIRRCEVDEETKECTLAFIGDEDPVFDGRF